MTWGSTEDPQPSDEGGVAFGLLMAVLVVVFIVLPIVCSIQPSP